MILISAVASSSRYFGTGPESCVFSDRLTGNRSGCAADKARSARTESSAQAERCAEVYGRIQGVSRRFGTLNHRVL